jgi:ADP-dependent NAD(P)H-hydrate dehydratase
MDQYFPSDGGLLTCETLRAWPLPLPSAEVDKEERGRVLIIGGSREMPGTMILAANAALHAGAGKVAIATVGSTATALAIAVPESRVIAIPEPGDGAFVATSVHALENVLKKVDAVLIGPGMQDEAAACELVLALLPKLGHAKVVLDAYAMGVVRDTGMNPVDGNAARAKRDHHEHGRENRFLGRFDARVLLTPHAGEMAHLTGSGKDAIQNDPHAWAQRAARNWHAVVALKGATTHIAAPDDRHWRHEAGNIGLAVSGSGDTLSGIIVGLAARGASLEQAGAWGVALHALAGERLAARSGPLGFLIRDLAAEVPALLHMLRTS